MLSDKVRETTFIDAKASGSDPALLGPPSVEFAPYGRIPHGKIRKDARQGTIDQDPEFIDFLESLTSPAAKPAPPETAVDNEANKGDATVVTPLIQYLRDKKANKGKDPVPTIKATKHARNDSKDSKTSPPSDKKVSPKSVKEPISPADKRSATAIKVEKAAREAVKVLNKHAVNSNRLPASSPAASVPPSSTPPAAAASPTSVVEKRRERGNASVAARILQRDLGISTNPGGRRRRDVTTPPGNVATANAVAPTRQGSAALGSASRGPDAADNAVSSLSTQSTKSPMPPAEIPNTKPDTSKISSVSPTGPAASRSLSKPAAPSVIRAPPAPPPNKPVLSSPTSTQAFLKHANPSQGVTEPLLQEAFIQFGTINKVEIDKKKGFAYIDFADSDGLQKAIKASPVKVAQGQVVVLERKVGSTLQARNVRGGPIIGGRGNAMPTGPRSGRGASARGRGGIARGGSVVAVANPTTTTATPTSSLSTAALPSVTNVNKAVPATSDAPPQPLASTAIPTSQTSGSAISSLEEPSV